MFSLFLPYSTATQTCSETLSHRHILFQLHTHPHTHLLCSTVLTLPSLCTSGCMLNRQDVRLILHYEKGFTVTREPGESAGGAVLFRYPFEKLKMSADDGIRNLYLDFGGPEGEMVSYITVRVQWSKSSLTVLINVLFVFFILSLSFRCLTCTLAPSPWCLFFIPSCLPN